MNYKETIAKMTLEEKLSYLHMIRFLILRS